MPTRLKRYYGAKHLHFITCSCYHRLPRLGTPRRRDLFLKVLEQARQRYRFVVVGYVVMPEHFHLLMSKPERGDPSIVLKVVKQRFARILHQRGSSTLSSSPYYFVILNKPSHPCHPEQATFFRERKNMARRRTPIPASLLDGPGRKAWG